MTYRFSSAAAGACLLLAAVVPDAHAGSYANPQLLIETEALQAQLETPDPNIRVIDVRSRADYLQGHIANAVHLGADDVIDPDSPVSGALLPDAVLAAMLGARGIDKDTMVVLYDDKGGFHASRLFWMLEYFGHRKVALLNGGFPKWESEGRPTRTEDTKVEARTFVVAPTPRRLASADWLLERRDQSDVVVVDVRPAKLFKAGHIPWARNIGWKQNLTEDGTLKPATALKAQFAAQGVTPDKRIAVHCQNGKAAAHSYFTLRLLGYPEVRSYDRSWMEWGADDSLPKATATQG